MKRHLGMALGLVLLVAASSNAATLPSDNFDDGVLGPQWDTPAIVGTATVQESGGSLNFVATGSGSNATLKPKAGYVLSGEFDVAVDININNWSFEAGMNPGEGICISYVALFDTVNTSFLSMQHRNAGAGWYELAYKTNGTFEYKFAGLEDVKYRLTRVGAMVTGYYWMNDQWNYLNSTGFGENDVRLELYAGNYQKATLTDVSFDNLVVPEPATLSLLAVGGLLAIRRRKRC